MATIDRISPGYTAWTPSSAGISTEDETSEAYRGRHRKPEIGKTFSLHRMLHSPKHRRRH